MVRLGIVCSFSENMQTGSGARPSLLAVQADSTRSTIAKKSAGHRGLLDASLTVL
jgi:hypothetical protein